jgi:hypothetical protein
MGEVVTWLQERWKELAVFALTTFRAIGKALAAGDIPAAANVLWAALRVAWTTGAGFIRSIWADAMSWLVKLAGGAFYGMLAAGQWLWTMLKKLWINGAAVLKGVWTELVIGYSTMVEIATDSIAQNQNESDYRNGKISKADFERNKAYLAKMSNDKMSNLEAERRAKLKAIDEEAAAANAANNADYDRRMAEIGGRYNALAKGADTKAAEDKAAAKADEADAMQKWKDAVKAADAAGANVTKAEIRKAAGPGALNVDTSWDATGAAAAAEARRSLQGLTAGAFGANARFLALGGDRMELVAKASQATAKNTARIAARMDEMNVYGE